MSAVIDKKILDFVTEAGPRAFNPLVPPSVRLEIAKSDPEGVFRATLKKLAKAQLIRIWSEIDLISYENAHTDWKSVKGGIGLPYARFPASLVAHFKELYGEDCWPDDEFMEDTLKHHPGLRVPVRFGTRGQEYGGKRAVSGLTWLQNFKHIFGKTA